MVGRSAGNTIENREAAYKMTRLQKTAGLMITIMLALCLTACGKSVDILQLIDGKDYDKALEAFDASKYDEDELSNLEDEIKKRIEAKLDAYANGEVETDDIKEFLTTVYKLDIDGTSSAISKAKTKMNELSASKKAYNEAIEQINDKDFAAAYRKLDEVIEADANYKSVEEKKAECVQKYCDLIADKEKEYTDKNDLDGAKQYLKTELNKDLFSGEIRDFIQTKQAELVIPTIINSAEAYAEEEDYYNAFYVLEASKSEQGFGNSTEYSAAVSNIKEDYKQYVTKNTDSYVAAKDYSGALSFLSKQSSTAYISGLSDFVDEKYKSIEVKSVIAKADEYVKDNDIATAITEITTYKEENDITDNAELNEYLDNVSKSYVAMILERVTALEEKENYIMALNILSNAKIVIDAKEFNDEVDKINAVKPVYLYDLKCTNWNRFSLVNSGKALTDTIGNKYEVGGNLYTISCKSNYSDYYGYAEYYLGYRYKTLTGILAVDDSSNNVGTTFMIEGDNIQLYSINLSRKTIPTSFTVDISNVNWLRIKLVGNDYGDFLAILSDFQFSDQEIKQTEDSGKKKKDKNKKKDTDENDNNGAEDSENEENDVEKDSESYTEQVSELVPETQDETEDVTE